MSEIKFVVPRMRSVGAVGIKVLINGVEIPSISEIPSQLFHNGEVTLKIKADKILFDNGSEIKTIYNNNDDGAWIGYFQNIDENIQQLGKMNKHECVKCHKEFVLDESNFTEREYVLKVSCPFCGSKLIVETIEVEE